MQQSVVQLPIPEEIAEQLRRLFEKARRNGYGQIDITIHPKGIKIVETTEYRFDLTSN